MDLHKQLTHLQKARNIGLNGFYEIYNNHSDDTDILEILASNPHTPIEIKNKIVDAAVVMESGYQHIFWGFLLNNPSTTPEILDKMARKKETHPSILDSIVSHPNVSDDTLAYVIEKSSLSNRSSNLEDKIRLKLIKTIVDRERLSLSIFNKLLLETDGPHNGRLITTHSDLLTLPVFKTILDEAPRFLYYIADTPRVEEEEISIPISLLPDYDILMKLAKNQHTPSIALKNMWDLTSSLDNAISKHHNCPDDLKEKALAKTKLEKLDEVKNKFSPSFKVPEKHYSEDIPNKINTDLELLLKLKSHLKG